MGVEEERAPTFVQKPKLRQERDGDVIIFECVVLAFPKPDVVWYFKDKVFVSTAKKTSEIRDLGPNRFYIALKITYPEDQDSGLYRVAVTNTKGDATGTISVNFSAEEERDPFRERGFHRKPWCPWVFVTVKVYFQPPSVITSRPIQERSQR